LRIDNLACGTLFPPLASGFHRCRWIIQRASSKLHQTIPGMPIFIPVSWLFLSPSRRNLYRLLPVLVIDIIPESLSSSSRNAYRLAPDYAVIFKTFTKSSHRLNDYLLFRPYAKA
jgi:hypothetical protein